MDKVIIDGVDVSECEHYRAEIETKMPYGEYETLKDKCHYSGIEIIQNCKGNKGCIYKQLKRLQTENERLKEENYQLQKDCQICENFIDFIPCKPIRDMDYDLQKVISQRDNYYQVLQEIRDMATLFHSVNENKDLDRFKNNILYKINEVIGAE